MYYTDISIKIYEVKNEKNISILLALFFALTLFGCGGNEKQSAVNSKNGKNIK